MYLIYIQGALPSCLCMGGGGVVGQGLGEGQIGKGYSEVNININTVYNNLEH